MIFFFFLCGVKLQERSNGEWFTLIKKKILVGEIIFILSIKSARYRIEQLVSLF